MRILNIYAKNPTKDYCPSQWKLQINPKVPGANVSKTVSIHTFQPSYIGQVCHLLDRELHADSISPLIFAQKVFLDRNYSPEGVFVASAGSQIVGFMLGIIRRYPLEDAPPDFDRGWITLMAVDRGYQRQGIGTRLLEHVSAYLRHEGAKSIWVSPYAPNYFWPGVDEAAYQGAIAFLKKHNYEVVMRPLAMEATLSDQAIPDDIMDREKHLTTEGITFDIIKHEYIPALLELLRREFPGDWQRILRESLSDICSGRISPDHVFVAMSNGECIGFCRHEGERFGPFGVAGQVRGRGVGRVLLFKCQQSMKAKGLTRAWLMWTDERAARLYTTAGFRETRRFALMKREL